MHKKLECLLVSTANGEPYDEYLELATAFYKGDFDRSLLSTQLQNLVCRKERESVSQRVCSIPQRSITGTKVIFQRSMQSCSPDPYYAGYKCGQRTQLFSHEMSEDLSSRHNVPEQAQSCNDAQYQLREAGST